MSKYFIFIPNLLSILRIGLVYPILYNIFIGNFIVSLGYFLVASITDALDGFLARKMKWQTYLGTLLDPIADKLLLSGTIFILWLNSYIPLYIFVIFIGRDIVILLGAALHMTLMDSEAPLPNILGKVTTSLQISYIVVILFFQIFDINLSLILLDVFILIVTLSSLIVYARNWFLDINSYHNE
ncbi:CDP-alcohol phosphatidyltransferase family protein [Gammaproteobacteria bacterium]|nr:CDP-alcohol phosphatidyltransferase family protein [Gammaproteobacteria bacterium]